MEKKPRTDKQIAASRANGAKSRGPLTEEGKARSAQNALKHGLYAADLPLSNEQRPLYDQLCARYLAQFCPQTPTAVDLVEDLCAARWRLRRLRNSEPALYEMSYWAELKNVESTFQQMDEGIRQAWTMQKLQQEGTLKWLYTTEERLLRSYHRALRKLEAVQNEPEPDNAQSVFDATWNEHTPVPPPWATPEQNEPKVPTDTPAQNEPKPEPQPVVPVQNEPKVPTDTPVQNEPKPPENPVPQNEPEPVENAIPQNEPKRRARPAEHPYPRIQVIFHDGWFVAYSPAHHRKAEGRTEHEARTQLLRELGYIPW